jgi:aminopeptidase N
VERIDITKRTERFTFNLDSRPRMVVFDKGERILKKLDFPQATEMTVYQLTHSADALARTDAAESLKQKGDSALFEDERRDLIQALSQALMNDSFYGVRAAAASALSEFKNSEAINALLEGTKDADERVRAASVAGVRSINTGADSRDSNFGLLFSIMLEETKESHTES